MRKIKTAIKKAVSFFTAATICVCALCAATPSVLAVNYFKLDPSLLQSIADTPRAKYSVRVKLYDPYSSWASENNIDPETPRDEVYTEYYQAVLASCGLQGETVWFSVGNFIDLVLSEEDIFALSDSKYVDKVFDEPYSAIVGCSLNSTDALKILLFSTGQSQEDVPYDINNDGKINSSDALLVLQSSVGIISIYRHVGTNIYSISYPALG